MTGLHTGNSQIRGNKEIAPEGQQPMEGDTYTIGKMMKQEGYTTGIFGKWGLMSFMDTIANAWHTPIIPNTFGEMKRK